LSKCWFNSHFSGERGLAACTLESWQVSDAKFLYGREHFLMPTKESLNTIAY